MPDVSSPVAADGRKLRRLLEFITSLPSKLSNMNDVSSIAALSTGVNLHLAILERSKDTKGIPASLAKDLENTGRSLWTAVTSISRRVVEAYIEKQCKKLLLETRLLAVQIVSLGLESRRNNGISEKKYLATLTLTLGKLCLKELNSDLATIVLTKAADLVGNLSRDQIPESEMIERDRIEAEYLILRTALAWNQDCLDVAEHMFHKWEKLSSHFSFSTTTFMADVIFHIGNDNLKKGNSEVALKWLNRAHEAITVHEPEQLTIDGQELRLTILQQLIKALCHEGSPDSLQDAWDMSSLIANESLALHLRLEILEKTPPGMVDNSVYASTIYGLIGCCDFQSGSIEFILYHLKQLRDKCSEVAISLLDTLLMKTVSREDIGDAIEKAFATRVWMSTMESHAKGATAALQKFLDLTIEKMRKPLSSAACNACLSLIWKQSEAHFTEKEYTTVEKWCMVALHPAFTASEDGNKGKFGRKILQCALSTDDPKKAHSIFQSLPKVSQEDPISQFLLFKISLLLWDHELGSQSIKKLCQLSELRHQQDILYACLKEAQTAGDRVCTLAALKSLTLDLSNPGNLPLIYRCSIRLMYSMYCQGVKASELSNETDLVEDVCSIFEQAAHSAAQNLHDDQGDAVFNTKELEWFRKNCYNIGVESLTNWPTDTLSRLFKSCLSFIDCYPQDQSTSTAELSLMASRCHFIIAAALVSVARSEDGLEDQVQRYSEARSHIAAFDSQLRTESSQQDELILKDLLGKLKTLLVFDFEAATALKQWKGLAKIVQRATICRDEVMLKAMADCLLQATPPVEVTLTTMKLIVNQIFAVEQFDSNKLAKYIRCIFQATLPWGDNTALQLVDQAMQVAKEGSQINIPFPSAELEWLVASTFNHAIDFYAMGDEETCRTWALKAMDLAVYLEDDGALKDVLQANFAKLKIGGGIR